MCSSSNATTPQSFLRIAGLCLAISTSAAAQGETWSEKLGYPKNRRVLILTGTEMGLCWETNHAGRQLLEAGRIQSADVLVTAPWFENFTRWCRTRPGTDVGLSFALTNPYRRYRWRLISPRGEVPSLVDADGYPRRGLMQAAVTAQVEDVEREFHAQLRRAREAGLQISHLSSCYGAVFTRTDLAEMFLRLSIKYWIPADVVELTPEHIERFHQQGLTLSDELVRLVQDYPLPKLDDIRYPPMAENYEQKRERFCEMIRGLRPGLTQVVLTPAVESPGLAGISALWEQAVWDARLLQDEHVQEVLGKEAVIFTNWREIMRRYQGKRPDVEAAEDEDVGE